MLKGTQIYVATKCSFSITRTGGNSIKDVFKQAKPVQDTLLCVRSVRVCNLEIRKKSTKPLQRQNNQAKFECWTN